MRPTGGRDLRKETHEMNTTHNPKKKLVATALGAAAAAAAVVFVGAGTAQGADVYVSPNDTIGINPSFNAVVTVTENTNGAPGQYGQCNYTSNPVAGAAQILAAPPINVPFQLNQNQTVSLTITNDGPYPAFVTGTIWHSHIHCTDPNQNQGDPYDGNVFF